jgi:hypothetical protein
VRTTRPLAASATPSERQAHATSMSTKCATITPGVLTRPLGIRLHCTAFELAFEIIPHDTNTNACQTCRRRKHARENKPAAAAGGAALGPHPSCPRNVGCLTCMQSRNDERAARVRARVWHAPSPCKTTGCRGPGAAAAVPPSGRADAAGAARAAAEIHFGICVSFTPVLDSINIMNSISIKYS